MIIEREIGSSFTLDDGTVCKCIKDTKSEMTCSKCMFENDGILCDKYAGLCMAENRSDKKNVIFIKVR